MKKSFVFALITVFALALFAVGCKKEEAAPETTETAAPAAAPATETMATESSASEAPATKSNRSHVVL